MEINPAVHALGMNLDLVRDTVAHARQTGAAAPVPAAATADVVLTLSSAAQQLLAADRAGA